MLSLGPRSFRAGQGITIRKFNTESRKFISVYPTEALFRRNKASYFSCRGMASNTNTAESKNSDNQKHFWDILKGFQSVFLISRAPDGTEHGRPMGLQIKDQAIYFFTEVDSPKVHEIKDDFHITITGQKSDQWLFAKGQAKIITDKAKIAELWTETVRPWFPKDIKDSQVSLICLIPQQGEYWDQSAISTKMSFAWELGKAYITGQKAQKSGDMEKGGDQHSKVELGKGELLRG